MSDPNQTQWGTFHSQQGSSYQSPQPQRRQGPPSFTAMLSDPRMNQFGGGGGSSTPNLGNYPPMQFQGLPMDYNYEAPLPFSSEGSQQSNASGTPSEGTASSPNKRPRVKKVASRRGKLFVGAESSRPAITNKRWDHEHSDYMIEILVDEVHKGNKADKSFRKSSFVRAAAEVNTKFNETYTAENCSNHFRWLKTTWLDIMKTQEKSGAGWNEETKTITLDEESLNDLRKVRSKLLQYVNTPIRNYDNLRTICGEDHATGAAQKDIYESFGATFGSAINLDDSQEHDNVDVVDVDAAQGTGSSRGRHSRPKPAPSGARRSTSTHSTSAAKRKQADPVFDNLATDIGRMVSRQMARELGEGVYALQDSFPMEVLDAALDAMLSDPATADRYIARPLPSRKVWMAKFQKSMEEREAGNDDASEGEA